jgi:hypothetical protein
MHKNIVLFRDSISSTTKECIFLVGNPCTLYLGLLFFWHLRPSISPDFVILQYHIEIKKHLSEHLLVKPAMAGHWRQAFWSGFFEEPDFRPFVSKVETLQKEASDAWGAYVIYSRRHGRRLQTLDWRKSHLWYNPAPERVGDHLL